jgi:hypothetical protein
VIVLYCRLPAATPLPAPEIIVYIADVCSKRYYRTKRIQECGGTSPPDRSCWQSKLFTSGAVSSVDALGKELQRDLGVRNL